MQQNIRSKRKPYKINKSGKKVKWAELVAKATLLTMILGGISWLVDLIPEKVPEFKLIKPRENDTSVLQEAVVDSLFSKPYYFFNEREISANEIIESISISNGEIQIDIVPKKSICAGYNYILKKKVINGNTINIVMPVYYFDFDGRWFSNSLNDKNYNEWSEIEKRENSEWQNTCNTDDTLTYQDLMLYDHPTLNIRVNNNSDKSILIKKVTFRVKKSVPNKFPLIHFADGSYFNLDLYNLGFASAKNVVVKFAIQPFDAPINYKCHKQYQIAINEIEAYTSYEDLRSNTPSLSTFFQREGIDTLSVKNLDNNYNIGDSAFLSLARATLGKYFYRTVDSEILGIARIVGTVMYDGILPSGLNYRDTLNFNSAQLIYTLGAGGPIPQYKDGYYNISLNSDDVNYTRSYFVNENIKPLSSVSFDLSVNSDCYAYHLFDLVLEYNNCEEIIIENIFLNEFTTAEDLEKRKDWENDIFY